MSISALPPSSVHLLRSSSTIADPISLVKELVDNSIDAGATSIDISITPNTVDKIQVRDNGRGIQLDDYGLLGRRSHTSKLRSYDELQSKGGKTLGFRGEALASANCLATIKITTRTAQDPVASLLLLKGGSGGISKQQPVSGIVGTTVQALNLFQNVPVRKQNAIKVSRKTLADIKRLLETYVLALPHLKLTFKVPGGSCQPWLYSPCTSSNTREAITQVFGHSLAAQIVEISSDLNTNGSSTEAQSQGLVITVLLPRPESDVKVIKGKGAFISVDSRPISSTRGTGKKLVAIFKSSILGVLGSSETSRAPPNPFIQLSIKCSPGSYDPNVSPLKDEVLFADEPAILSCFQNLCDAIYNNQDSASNEPQDKPLPNPEPEPRKMVYEGNAENEDFPTDQELIDSLNDGLERVLGGSSGAFGTGPTASPRPFSLFTSPKHTTRPGSRHEPLDVEEAGKVEQMMRTKSMVNLSRKESNSTDVDGTEGLVPVQVVPRRAATPLNDKPQTHSRHRTLTPNNRFEDIGHYFRPVRDEPVEIATDETATPENTQPENNLTNPHGTHRLPLKELTDSDLNTFREEEDEEEDDDGSVIDLPVAEVNVGPSPRTSPRRVAPSLPPSNPFRPLTRPLQATNPDLQLEQLVNLQTPPSSDPTRIENSTRQDSRRQSTNNISNRGQRSSRGLTISLADRTADHGLRQSRLLLGGGQTVSHNRRRSEQVRHGSGLTGRRNILTTSRDDSDAHLKDLLHNSHADPKDQEG
ncbi:hypothetical protein FSARC_2003 [Fusarium sarcochroum]|uniref:DNA mismatch repair protein S5 domain-containing protein n=1 Tax=Fusarium sarcochroum TaxID=1208366 RepID=A0A8H4U762_9HYPO|nr:hypothetical protein FSARC_2003 [Fusarium sarcochroum]